MFDKFSQMLHARVKFFAVMMVLVGFGFVAYMFIHGWFTRIQMVWETKMQTDVAEVFVLADQKVDSAKADVDMACGTFSLSGKEEGPDCKPARAELAAALKHKADVEAKRATLLSQAGKTKEYYDGVIASSHQKPLPFYFFVGMGLIILGGIIYFLLPFVQNAINKGGASCADSEDGLR